MRGLVPEAIVRYKTALQYAPRYPAVHFALARTYRLIGQIDSAAYHAELCVRIDSTNADAVELLAELLRERGYPAAAASQYEALLRLDADRLQARFELARLIERDDPRRAISHLKYLADRVPDDDVVAFALADLLRDNGDTGSAIVPLLQLLDANRDDVALQESVLLYALDLGRMEQMLPVVARLTTSGRRAQADESLMAVVIASVHAAGTNRNESMRQWGLRLVGVLRDREWINPGHLLPVARLSLVMDDSIRADDLVARAIDGGVEDALIVPLLHAYLQERRFERAESLLRRAAQRPSPAPDVFVLLGIAERETGKLREGERHIRRALAIEQSPLAYEELAWLRYLRGDFESALRYIQRSLEMGGPTGRLFERMGAIHQARGDNEKAREAYSQSLRLQPDNPRLREVLRSSPFDGDSHPTSSVSRTEADEQQQKNTGPTP